MRRVFYLTLLFFFSSFCLAAQSGLSGINRQIKYRTGYKPKITLKTHQPRFKEKLTLSMILNFEKIKLIPNLQPSCYFEEPSSGDWNNLIGVLVKARYSSGLEIPLDFNGRGRILFYKEGQPVVGFIISKRDIEDNFKELEFWISKNDLICPPATEKKVLLCVTIYNFRHTAGTSEADGCLLIPAFEKSEFILDCN